MEKEDYFYHKYAMKCFDKCIEMIDENKFDIAHELFLRFSNFNWCNEIDCAEDAGKEGD